MALHIHRREDGVRVARAFEFEALPAGECRFRSETTLVPSVPYELRDGYEGRALITVERMGEDADPLSSRSGSYAARAVDAAALAALRPRAELRYLIGGDDDDARKFAVYLDASAAAEDGATLDAVELDLQTTVIAEAEARAPYPVTAAFIEEIAGAILCRVRAADWPHRDAVSVTTTPEIPGVHGDEAGVRSEDAKIALIE